MTSQLLPYCCGVILVAEFGNTINALDSTAYKPEEVDIFLKKYDCIYYRAMVIATLNEEQHKKLGETFVKNGFNVVSSGFHQGHNNNIYLYSKVCCAAI